VGYQKCREGGITADLKTMEKTEVPMMKIASSRSLLEIYSDLLWIDETGKCQQKAVGGTLGFIAVESKRPTQPEPEAYREMQPAAEK
jgi:hypothetical protein